MPEPLVGTQIAGSLAEITLRRPAKRNAINGTLCTDFRIAASTVADAGATVCILSAEGSVYSAGADVTETASAEVGSPTEEMLATLGESPMLWVAAVQGPAIGAGVALALSCPIVVMEESSWMWLPELEKLNRMPMGVISQIAPMVGARAAFAMAISQRRITATEAYDRGWITDVAADARAESRKLGRLIAESDSSAVETAVRLWRRETDSVVSYRDTASTE